MMMMRVVNAWEWEIGNAYLTVEGVKLHEGDKADLTVNMKCIQKKSA